ncbi:hypothetical protein MCOR25_004831 [Pyricularia grisea]|nr:hypothetical protein MCOR25_004831 [Pyricularia grisea]
MVITRRPHQTCAGNHDIEADETVHDPSLAAAQVIRFGFAIRCWRAMGHSTYQYVTTFNKASQIGNYGIVLSMVPELGIRINIAAACDFSANINMALADTLANSSIQPLLDVANRTYGGWYRHQTLSSSLLVTGHPVNPGLEISSWAVHDRLGDLDLALRDHVCLAGVGPVFI